MNLPDQYPATLAELAELLHARLAPHLDAATADALALDLVEAIRQRYSGEMVYIPKGDAFALHQRNARIWRAFNGRNYGALAREYGLAVGTVYEIIAAERAKRQAPLFFD